MPRVYRINEIVKPRGPIARSTLYLHAAQGRIELRKLGGATIVTEAAWVAYLAGEPMAHRSHHATAYSNPSHAA